MPVTELARETATTFTAEFTTHRPVVGADRFVNEAAADLAEKITGRVVTAADADWDAIRQVFNLTTDLRPAAMVLPRAVDDVVEALRHASEHGLTVVSQATGHNAAPYGDLSGALMIDMREMREIAIDAMAHRVRVGAGVRWQDVVPTLSGLGLAALHGSSPLVGIAGYSLGGGIGWLARKYGMQTNAVLALEVVTADGQVRRVDADHAPELFWALRGGNGNFGVVTAIEFRVFPVRELYAGNMFFPLERADEVLTAWTTIAPKLPEEMMTWTSLLQLPTSPTCRSRCAAEASLCSTAPFSESRRRARRCCGRSETSVRRSTRTAWCHLSSSPTRRWTRPSRCRSRARRLCSATCPPEA